jgi:homoserine O-acetyltransferase
MTSFVAMGLIGRLRLEKIEAWVRAINSADDERNPPETGIEVAAMNRVKNGKLYLIPASDQTSGHLTTGNARFYGQQLQDFLQMVPWQAASETR